MTAEPWVWEPPDEGPFRDWRDEDDEGEPDDGEPDSEEEGTP